MVRSWMMSRSSSAKAAIIVKKNLPVAGRGVGAGQLAGQDADADAAFVQVVGDGQHVLDERPSRSSFQTTRCQRRAGSRARRAGRAGRGGLPCAGLLW